MQRKTGTYEITAVAGERVRAFIPAPLPPQRPVLQNEMFAQPLAATQEAIARLNTVSTLTPSVDWLIYASVRKEALLTSQIEGTQASLTDLFDAESAIEVGNPDDVEEVSNYLKAVKFVRKNLLSAKGLPVSSRLLCEAHKLLLSGTRGRNKQPGLIRTSQNWIGGTRPGNAVHVPPPAQHVQGLMGALEKYIHDGPATLAPLLRIGLIHVQFETIHPFLDGNGRIGRLLVTTLLEDWRIIEQPLIYPSGYFKMHQSEYYRRLNAVRSDGDWEGWLAFFLEGLTQSARDAERLVLDTAKLVLSHRKKLLALDRVSPTALKLFELLPSMPRLTVERVRKTLKTTFPTANAAVATLVRAGLLTERTGRRKYRSFSYESYVKLLSR